MLVHTPLPAPSHPPLFPPPHTPPSQECCATLRSGSGSVTKGGRVVKDALWGRLGRGPAYASGAAPPAACPLCWTVYSEDVLLLHTRPIVETRCTCVAASSNAPGYWERAFLQEFLLLHLGHCLHDAPLCKAWLVWLPACQPRCRHWAGWQCEGALLLLMSEVFLCPLHSALYTLLVLLCILSLSENQMNEHEAKENTGGCKSLSTPDQEDETREGWVLPWRGRVLMWRFPHSSSWSPRSSPPGSPPDAA